MIEAVPSTISQVKTLTKSVRITVDTQENLSPETMAKIFGLKDSLGWFFFAEKPEALPEQVDTAKLPEIPDVQLEDGEKSPSQRLRAALFVYWQQQTDQKQDFELFYRRWMERAINGVKEKLT